MPGRPVSPCTVPVDKTPWGEPISPGPWEFPVLGARGFGFIRLADNLENSGVNRLHHLTIKVHLHHAAGAECAVDENIVSVSIWLLCTSVLCAPKLSRPTAAVPCSPQRMQAMEAISPDGYRPGAAAGDT